MIKVSDFIFRHLVESHNIHHCFLVTGGGAMHLNDSVGHTEGLTYICNHHEQASAIAAEGYYRAGGHLCVTNVTTGPGGTNAVTGVLGQWLDSIPGLYISGQIKTATMKGTYPRLNLRQLGDQEADIVEIVKSITKYAVIVTNPLRIKYELDKALAIATGGRPGPVWLDIPLDVQSAMVDENQLLEFNPSELVKEGRECTDSDIIDVIKRLRKAKRPVIYAGGGIRLAGRAGDFVRLAERIGAPVVKSISGADIIWHDHELSFGSPGICGDRLGNIMVQNSDLVLILGTRLGIRQIGYAYDLFAPNAYKIMVDVDSAELDKPTLRIDRKINCNISDFIDRLGSALQDATLPDWSKWKKWGRDVEKRLPTLTDDNPDVPGYTNSYRFADRLFSRLTDGDCVVTGNGTAYTCTFQAMKVGKGVRVFANQGCAAMGYDLPAAIGACVANTKGRTVLVTGDGSIQMNIQELQTVVTNKLPVKIFILENEGYLAIKTTQQAFFGGHYTGSDPGSGVVCPSMEKLAAAYGIPYVGISENGAALDDAIEKTLAENGPMICEVHMDPLQTLFPKSASFMGKDGKMTSAPLEKMKPFMDDELQESCHYSL